MDTLFPGKCFEAVQARGGRLNWVVVRISAIVFHTARDGKDWGEIGCRRKVLLSLYKLACRVLRFLCERFIHIRVVQLHVQFWFRQFNKAVLLIKPVCGGGQQDPATQSLQIRMTHDYVH